MTSRIVVTGSECTGKTTLSQRLAERLGALWLPEYARTYAESLTRPLSVADVEPIARGQIRSEDAVLSSHPPLVVQDTDIVSTVVYAEHYYGACPPWIAEQALARLASIYLLCDIDVPWAPDGVRDQPEARQIVHMHFRLTLERLGAHVASVSGLGPLRLERALVAVRSSLGLGE